VDHGKLLARLHRKSNIIAGESGGITQHIGAYYVERKGGDIVSWTPRGTKRSRPEGRGAKVTDIIVLVVAADDGVMQNQRSDNHGSERPHSMWWRSTRSTNPRPTWRESQRAGELGLAPEEWGGQTIFGSISAKTGQGVDELLELILLQAEVLELKANPESRPGETVIEDKLDKNGGPWPRS